MSPSPDLSPQKPSPADDLSADAPTPSLEETPLEPVATHDEDKEDAPILRKPPMRPVRPPAAPTAPKASTSAAAKPDAAAKPATPKLEIISVSSAADVANAAAAKTAEAPPDTTVDPNIPASMRQRPIPLPSEPKQYRAIGLVRGTYTPSEEEFTRGDFKAVDGTDMKAVLLGRVMSLVKKHIALDKEHLWVVYPRTREEQKELHLQIVGVWEPETLKKEDGEGEGTAIEQLPSDDEALLRDDNYFSIRGEIVFIAPDDQLIVVKIQQTPRKNSQKAKAFKLSLQGEVDNTRAVGYFWDFQIRRSDQALVVEEATCIGLAPPKKRDKTMVSKGRPRKPMPGRSAPGTGGKPVGAGSSRPVRPGMPRPNKEGSIKPSKPGDQAPSVEG